MLKKMLLAGVVIMGGAMFTSEKADAQIRMGPGVRYGSPVFRPPVRTFNPYVVPRYGYGYGYRQPAFRGPAFGAPAYRGPVYRSYRGPVGVPFYGPGMGRGGGFSLQIGPQSYWGW